MKIWNAVMEQVIIQLDHGHRPTKLYIHPTTKRSLEQEVHTMTYMVFGSEKREKMMIQKLKSICPHGVELEIIEVDTLPYGGLMVW